MNSKVKHLDGVWIVTSGQYPEMDVEGVFRTIHEAKRFVRVMSVVEYDGDRNIVPADRAPLDEPYFMEFGTVDPALAEAAERPGGLAYTMSEHYWILTDDDGTVDLYVSEPSRQTLADIETVGNGAVEVAYVNEEEPIGWSKRIVDYARGHVVTIDTSDHVYFDEGQWKPLEGDFDPIQTVVTPTSVRISYRADSAENVRRLVKGTIAAHRAEHAASGTSELLAEIDEYRLARLVPPTP